MWGGGVLPTKKMQERKRGIIVEDRRGEGWVRRSSQGGEKSRKEGHIATSGLYSGESTQVFGVLDEGTNKGEGVPGGL